jgi:UDP-N-acetylglucosamine--N-acetylmuramyl-(pentapeptide) pyrophosphoryl-undecaprenol N-acetylglucosamine transferase
LFQTACEILQDQEKRTRMEQAMASLGIRDATERIYRTILEIPEKR